MQKVHCHSQEYWVITRTKCPCGGMYSRASVFAQQMERRGAVDVDVLWVRCEKCGGETEFVFDISSFFNKTDPSSFQELLGDEQRAWEMYVWHELRMEAAVKYLSELSESGDALALEYIADAARHFLDKIRTTAS